MTTNFSLSKAYFVALFCEAILHGVFTVLAGGTLYLLLRKRKRMERRRTSQTNIVMIFLTIVMYSLSTVHVGLSMRQNLIAFFDQHAADGGLTILNDQGNPIVYSQITIEAINCLFGDSIVCWRVWVLWGRDFRVIIPPAVFIVGGTASSIGMIRAFAVSPDGQEVYNDDITHWFLGFGSLTCAANIYCLAAISYKAWSTLRKIRRYNKDVVIHGGKYQGALLVIVESGVLYSVALIVTVCLFIVGNNGVYVIADMIVHLTGIYPTVIIVLVSLQMTFHDDMTRAENTLSTMRCQVPGPDTVTTQNEAVPHGGRTKRGRGTFAGAGTELDAGGAFVLEPMAFAEGSMLDLGSGGRSGTTSQSQATTKGENLV